MAYEQAKLDARSFIDRWGETAEADGWGSADLFDCGTGDRYQAGLIWHLKGCRVAWLNNGIAIMNNWNGPMFDKANRTISVVGAMPLGPDLIETVADCPAWKLSQ